MAGLITVDRNEQLPLKSCSIKVEVHSYLVGLNATLKYCNDGNVPVQVVFTLPSECNYNLLGMEATVGGRKIKIALKDNREEKGECSGATSEKVAANFQISLGCLPAGKEATINLKLIGELPAGECGEAIFTLPTIFHSDQAPMSEDTNDVPKEMPTSSPAEFDFQMAIQPRCVSQVTSSTHALLIDKREDVIMVSVSLEDGLLKNDLVVLIYQKEPILVSHEVGIPSMNEDQNQSAYMGSPVVMVSYFPTYHVKDPACELIFLVDCSKSMKGSKIHCAGEALVFLLKSIPIGCSFNIIGFGATVNSLFEKSAEYNEENLQQAMKYIESLKAERGSADLLGALKHVFSQYLMHTLSRQIFILTAGSVDSNQMCIDEVSKNVQKCRVFAFGFGCETSEASRDLVNGLANAGRGMAEIIMEGNRVQPKVIGCLVRALQPSVTLLKAEFQIPPEYEVQLAPSDIKNVYDGDKLVFYGVIRNKADPSVPIQSRIEGVMKLNGRVAGLKNQETDMGIGFTTFFVVPPSHPQQSTEEQKEVENFFNIPIVHHSAAKCLLKDWGDGKGWASSASLQEKERASIMLSIESSTLCDYTTLVAIDEEQKKPIRGAVAGTPLGTTQESICEEAEVKHHQGTGIFRSIKKLYISATSHHHRVKGDEADVMYHSLSALVSCQHASGFWQLQDVSEIITKTTVSASERPAELSEEVWATLLALSFLDYRYLKEKEEWKLIAIKAKKWLNNQNLPADLESLQESAKTVIVTP